MRTEWLTREAIRVACCGKLVNLCSNLMSGYRAKEGSIAYTRDLVWLLCWRSLSSVLEKLLLGFACWEKFISVCQKLLPRYLVEKDRVLWAGNCSHIMLRKNWGALPHKFLPIVCGIMLGLLYPKLHTDMQTEIHAHVHNILRLIICMRKIVWLSSLSISHPDFLLEYNIFQVSFIAEPKLCLWSIPLTEKYTVGLASDLSFCWLDHYCCRIDADNQSKTQLAFWADIPYIMRLTEKAIMFSWASCKYLKYLFLLRVRYQLMSNSL